MPAELPPTEKNSSAYVQRLCENENEQEMEAHIIQHELDHINEGVPFFEKILAECSEAQKQEMIECIALFQAGQVEENEDESLKRALCFGRDETGKVIFYPEVFKMGPLDISHETLAGLKKSLIS